MTSWTIAMAGVAIIFWVVAIAARIETSRLRKTLPGDSMDKKDLTACIEALLEIREIEVPPFAGCAACKLRAQDMAWKTNNLLTIAQFTASNALLKIATPLECEFCNEGRVACPSLGCFGGNTRDNDYCPVCQGSGAIRCEDCDGKGVC